MYVPQFRQTMRWKAYPWYLIRPIKTKKEISMKQDVEKIVGKRFEEIRGIRLHLQTSEMSWRHWIYSQSDGLEWSKPLDAFLRTNHNEEKHVYATFSYVENDIARIRENYSLVRSQLYHLINYKKTPKIYFVNIMDGNLCFQHMHHFDYLRKKYPLYIQNRVYIGDARSFTNWWLRHIM